MTEGIAIWPNLVTMFFAQAEKYGNQPFLWEKKDGTYQPLSWRETSSRVTRLARGLRALGVVAGDRIVLVS